MTLLFALLLQTAPVATPSPAATPTPEPCTAITAPPAGFEAWSQPTALPTDTITVGANARLTLTAAPTYALPPERAPAAGTFGGAFRVKIATAGTYRIALKTGAWIDLLRDGKALKSNGHTEGPPCSRIRKIVDFDLTPGSYTLQLSGAKGPGTRVLIIPK